MIPNPRWWAARSGAAGIALALAAAPAGAAEASVLDTSTLRAVDARSAALLMSGQQGGELDLRLLAIGSGAAVEGEAGAIDLVLDVGAGGLAPVEVRPSVTLAFYVYALDAAGRVAGILKEGARLESGALATPRRAGVKLLGRLALPPGDYRLRVLAVRPDSGEFGMVVGAASVPAEGAAAPAVLALEPAERWLVARASSAAAPFDAAGELVPAARPALSRSSTARLELLLRDAEPAAGWRVGLGGEEERELALEAGGQRAGGWSAWTARTDAAGLRGGDYRLELFAPGASAPAFATPLALGSPGGASGPEAGALWTDFTGVAEPAAETAVPVATLPPAAISAHGLEGGYLEAIGQLAAGDEAGALDTLLAAEPAALGGDAGERFGRLLDVQLQVAGDLAQRDPESLVPLVRLHELAYSAYLKRGLPPLATRARRLSSRLALAYAQRARRAERDEAQAVAARALESQAARVLHGGGFLETSRLFLDAIELDPRAAISLRGLAMLLEFSGQYVEGLGFLERAAALSPGDAELRLRIAVHRARLGDAAGAERDLRACIDDGPDWTRSVAAQELARLLAARGARDEAIALLRAELERRPEPSSRIQLAALLDAADRRREATRLLAALETGAHADVDSPRRRYDRLREFPELADADRIFAAAARERLPALEAAYRELTRRMARR